MLILILIACNTFISGQTTFPIIPDYAGFFVRRVVFSVNIGLGHLLLFTFRSASRELWASDITSIFRPFFSPFLPRRFLISCRLRHIICFFFLILRV
jgi:hypothetical protein